MLDHTERQWSLTTRPFPVQQESLGGHPTKLPISKFGRTPKRTQGLWWRLGVQTKRFTKRPAGYSTEYKHPKATECKHPKATVSKAWHTWHRQIKPRLWPPFQLTWEKVIGEGGPSSNPHVREERSISEQITRTRVLGDISETKIWCLSQRGSQMPLLRNFSC